MFYASPLAFIAEQRISLSKQRKIKDKHIDFLCSQETLEKWAGKTLKERAKLFHREFPDIKISATSVARLYKSHKIKKKRIVFQKKLPKKVQDTYQT